MKKVFLFVLMGILVYACTSTQKATTTMNELYNKKWVLSNWGDSNDTLPPTMKEVFIQFTEQQVNGQSGCNNYFGGYTKENQTIKFERMASTMMACNDTSMTVEKRFHEMLEQVNRFEVTEEFLFFYRDTQLLAQFR